MAVKTAPLKPTPNAMILDYIRNKASDEYQRRVPSATKAGVRDTMEAIHEARILRNEFIDAFVNQVGMRVARHTSWTNPLAEFKLGMLSHGSTIQESQVGLLKAHNWDPDRDYGEAMLFGTERPEVQVNYHTINRRDMYKVTVSEGMLKNAFLDDMGLYELVNQLMAAPTTSDQWDEFLITCNLFSEYEKNGGFFKVNVPDVAHLQSSEADAKATLRRVREFADEATFLNTDFNAAGMPTFASRDDLVIFTTPKFSAAIDVEALAGSFNIEHSKMHGRVIPIPEKRFNIPGAQAVLTTKDFFMIADSLYETAQQPNAAGLSSNHFLHHHQVISASRFVPAIMFTTHAGDEIINVRTPVTEVKDITVKDASGTTATELKRGEIYEFGATVVTDGPNDGIRWTVENQTSSATYITYTGVLHVGGQEGATNLKVTATSTWLDDENLQRDGKSVSKTLPVTGAAIAVWPVGGAVTDISIKGVPVPGFASNVYTYDAVPVAGGKVTAKDISVSGVDRGDVKVTITNDGATAVIEAATAPGDPVYTVNVVAAA